ncbi:MAG: lactate utilization protein [Candidatus Odinarchaeota archaeon]|nr:lactate utilization protein [Candidatus Odinarchaeota archaeon]
MSQAFKDFEKNLEEMLKRDDIIKLRSQKFNIYNKNREKVKEKFNSYALEKEVREIRQWALEHNEELVKKAMESFEEHGIHGFFAETAEDARKYLLDVIGDEKVVVYSSTDLINEIGMFEEFEKRGITYVHSELAYRITQLDPDDIIFDKPTPVAHKTLDRLVKIVETKLKVKLPEKTPEAVIDAVRADVMNWISKAKIGISGANAISAADGAVFTVFGSANIAHMALRPIYVVLAGIEKVLPDMRAAFASAYLQSLYESGVGGTSYYLAVRGPSEMGPIVGKSIRPALGCKEMYVILLDNGRRRAMKEGFGDVLRCIRCFTCHEYCPVYIVAGPGVGYWFKKPGFGYGGYLGGRGIILTAFVFGLDAAIKGGLFACAMCGNCYAHCPMEINVPEMIARLRLKVIKNHNSLYQA